MRRREDARLVTGRGRYVADVALPGMIEVIQKANHRFDRGVSARREARRPRGSEPPRTLAGRRLRADPLFFYSAVRLSVPGILQVV